MLADPMFKKAIIIGGLVFAGAILLLFYEILR